MGGNPTKTEVPLRDPWGDYKENAISREPYIGMSGAIYQTNEKKISHIIGYITDNNM